MLPKPGPTVGGAEIRSLPLALAELDAEFFAVVEQDMDPVDFDLPRPIATRTRQFLTSVLPNPDPQEGTS